jgi:imidazolonepropionase-like amidohydrolase
MKIKRGIVLLGLLAGLVTAARAAWEPAYAIVGCRIIPVSGAPVEDGVIVIRNGLIEAVGARAKVPVPEDVEIVDGKGSIAYPGFIDAYSSIFIQIPPEPPPDPNEMFGSVQASKKVSGRTPEFMAFEHLVPGDAARDICHAAGILTALVVPQQRLFSGQSVLLNLNGGSPAEMVVQNPVALHIGFTGGRGAYPQTGMGVQAFLRQLCLDAAHCRANKESLAKWGKGVRRPVYDPFLETLTPYLLGKQPMVFACDNQEEIKKALRLIAECDLRGLIAGASEAWRVADSLKTSGIPLLLSVNYGPPSTSLYSQQGKDARDKAEKEIYPANAAKLSEAGIAFAFTSYGLEKGVDLLTQVRKAIKAGLAEGEALKALTLHPARFLGVDGQLGTIERGKIANIVLADGEIFKEATRVKQVFVDGRRFEIKKSEKESAAPGTGISGKWKGVLTGLEGISEISLDLKQEQGAVTGTLTAGGTAREIRDGKMESGNLSFSVVLPIAAKDTTMTFNGKVTKDTLEGALTHASGTAGLKAERIPEKTDDGGPR